MPTAAPDDILVKALTSRDLPKVRELHVRIVCIFMICSLFGSAMC